LYDNNVNHSIQYKVATAGDVAASNFTFSTSVTTDGLTGRMLRCSGHSTSLPLGSASSYSNNTAESATFAGTHPAFTPYADGALVVTQISGVWSSGGTVRSASTYTAPNVSFTEAYDSYGTDGSGGSFVASAYGVQSTATEISAYGATISDSTPDHYGQIAVFMPPTQVTSPTVESTATTNGYTDLNTSITIAKPTGLAEGDLMVAQIVAYDDTTSAGNVSVPSGWTQIVEVSDSGPRHYQNIMYKVATAGDVAASDFTFNTSGNSFQQGGIIRISGYASGPTITDYEAQAQGGTTSGTSISYSSTIDPGVPGCLVLQFWTAWFLQGTRTLGSYSTTPSYSVTELWDMYAPIGGDGSWNTITAASYFTLPTTSDEGITAYSAAINSSDSFNHRAILVTIPGNFGALGTTSFLTTSGSFFTPTPKVGTTGTTALITDTPDFFDPTSSVVHDVWTRESGTTTTWTRE
jgi:hypothetical protein